jgi:hypothetical protein
MQERDPFARLKKRPAAAANDDDGFYVPGKPLDYIPVAKVLPRSRQWEKANKAHAFRRVPPNVVQAVRQAATNEGLTVDACTQALLEYALMCYERGDFRIEGVLSEQRRTVMPEHGWGGQPRAHWMEKTWGLTPPRPKPVKARPEKASQPWRKVVAYRLSDDVMEKVSRLRQEKAAPAGEVLARLLMHALNAYENGRMVFVEGTEVKAVTTAGRETP